jgi:hypothetical protein
MRSKLSHEIRPHDHFQLRYLHWNDAAGNNIEASNVAFVGKVAELGLKFGTVFFEVRPKQENIT